ncbi:MAG: recombination protein O N-terminal domain-containing protein, partial [Actinomycetota bacterium]|nr:recombination protein O N-terminal domain-containing protein [Actinomycetota bacterium]
MKRPEPRGSLPQGEIHGIATSWPLSGRSPALRFETMPLYKEQGVVLRSAKLGEADKIVTVLTQ